MSELPSGWVSVVIDDLLGPLEDGRSLHHGWSPRCHTAPSESDGVWGVLKTTAVQPGRFLPEHNKRLPDDLTPRPVLEVKAGDLIITSAGPRARCGVACLVRTTRPRLILSGKMYRFRVEEELAEPRFVEAYLLSAAAQRAIDAMKTGISDSGLNLTHARFRKLPVPLPPLSEQRRIVAAIEEQLSRLEAADAALATARRRIGPLARGVRSVAVARGEVRAVGELLHRIEAGKSFRCHGRPADPDEWGIIKVSAMSWGSFDDGENKAVISNDRVDPRYEIAKGDLLLSRANTTELVGASVLVDRTRPRLLLSDKSMRLHPRDSVDRVWLQLALSAPESRRQMSAVATGTKDSMRNISQDKVKAIQLRVPPLEEQQRIVAEVEERLSAIDALRAAIERAQRRSAALRRAVLERAFRGELVPQDPSDEPAEALLARIRAERAGIATTGARR